MRPLPRRFLLPALMLLAACQDATAQELVVVDGDTVRLGEERIRIEGIDAPEIAEPACLAELMLGELAALRLEALLDAGEVEIVRTGVDVNGRTLALLYVDDDDVGERLVAEGYADYWLGRQVDWCTPLR